MQNSSQSKGWETVKFWAWTLALHKRGRLKRCFQNNMVTNWPGRRRRVTYREKLLGDILHYKTLSFLLSSLGSSPPLTWILRIACLSTLKFILLPVARVKYVWHRTLSLSCLKLFQCSSLSYGIKAKHDQGSATSSTSPPYSLMFQEYPDPTTLFLSTVPMYSLFCTGNIMY